MKTPDTYRTATILLVLVAFVSLFLIGCGGGSVPEVANNPGGTKVSNPPVRIAGTGAVYVRLVEAGEDFDVTGSLIAALVTKSLEQAGIKIASSDARADLVIHGVVKLRLKKRNHRLGIDECTYAAQAAFRLLHASGYREISVHEVTAEASGIGRKEAITNTMTELSGKITSEIAPNIKLLTASR